MYQAPDFVKVSTKMKDVFKNYGCDWNTGNYNANTYQDDNCKVAGEQTNFPASNVACFTVKYFYPPID